jgi:hypothetical protein
MNYYPSIFPIEKIRNNFHKQNISNSLIGSFKSLIKNKFDHIFLFFQIVILSGCIEQLEHNYTLLINFTFCFFLIILKKRLKIRVLFIVIFSSMLLIIIPTFQYGIEDVITIIGFFMRISVACMLVLYYREKFFPFFENLVFLLALISLPLYIIQIVDIHFFDLFKKFSELVLSKVRLTQGFGVLTGHRYLIVFLVNSWAEKRNSGFGWEPAVFGAILCWGIILNLFIYNTKVNLKLLIMFIAAITTFSIGTYFALFTIYAYFVLNQKNKTKLIVFGIIFFVIISSLSYYTETEERFDNYVIDTKEQKYLKYHQGNRFDAIFFGLETLRERPWGYGIRNKSPENIAFPNGFIVLVMQFGILGIFLISYLLFKLFQLLDKIYNVNSKGAILCILAIVATLNGSPISYQEIMFAFIISGFTLSKILRMKPSNLKNKYNLLSLNKTNQLCNF